MDNAPPVTAAEFNHFFRKRPALVDAELHRRYILPYVGAKPLDVFSLKLNRCTIRAPRYISNESPDTILIFVDGASLGNGQDDARAGFGVVFRAKGNISARLERPPQGSKPTSNRAELRAAICALQLRYWSGEGFERIVLASDSEYLVLGACDRLPTWIRNRWKTKSGTPVKNRDLWKRLAEELDRWEKLGISVQFWHIPRELNEEADSLAKDGAKMLEEPTDFQEIAALDIS